MTVEEFDIVKVGDRIYTESNKYVVVYRNKTRLYLKSSGTDILNFLQRDYMHHMRNYYLIPKGMDDSERTYYRQKKSLESHLESFKDIYQSCLHKIAQAKAEIDRTQKYLSDYESKVDIYRTDYEKAKREYEDFCKAHGFAGVSIDGISGNDA